jgi:threonine aldolase
MQQIWTSRLAQAAGKYGEHAPMATVCCNACRTCVTTNVFALVGAGVAGAGYKAAQFARRFVKTPTP